MPCAVMGRRCARGTMCEVVHAVALAAMRHASGSPATPLRSGATRQHTTADAEASAVGAGAGAVGDGGGGVGEMHTSVVI